MIYDSLRELLEALALSKGFKIYNHECYSAFLKEIIKDELSAEMFDEIRKLRNAINYYGKNLNGEETTDKIKEITDLRNKMKNYLKSNI